MTKFPIESDSQRIGQDARTALEANRPAAWRILPTDGDLDVGLDLRVQVISESQHQFVFDAQLKGSKQVREDGRSKLLNSDESFSVTLRTSTLMFLSRVHNPVMLIFADLAGAEDPRECPLYFAWLDAKKDTPKDDQTTQTIRVPKANRLTRETDVLPFLHESHSRHRAAEDLFRAISEQVQHPINAVQAITKRIGSSRLIIPSLATQPTVPWIEAPKDSVAFKLHRIGGFIDANNDALALRHLEKLRSRIAAEDSHERAEFSYLEGKCYMLSGDLCAAEECFLIASQNFEIEKYNLARIEARLYSGIEDEGTVSWALSEIQNYESDDAQFMRVKLLALQGEYSEAYAILPPSGDTMVARAQIEFLRGDYQACLDICSESADSSMDSVTKAFSLGLLSTKSKFNLANPVPQGHLIPIGGTSDMDPSLMKPIWDEVQECWGLAADLLFPPQVELLADITMLLSAYFGEEEAALGYLKAAAEVRATVPILREAIATLALRLQDYRLVFDQMSSLSDFSPRLLAERAHALQATEKYAEFVDLIVGHLELFERHRPPGYQVAIGNAALCAHQRLDFESEEKLMAAIRRFPEESDEFLDVHQFSLMVNDKKIARDQAVQDLFSRFLQRRSSRVIGEQLIAYLNPEVKGEAEQHVEVGKSLRAHRALTLDENLSTIQANLTLRNWQEVIELVDNCLQRFGRLPQLLAALAVAEYEAGNTIEATDILDEISQRGELFGTTYDFYAEILVRSGLLEKAREVLTAAATSVAPRMRATVYWNLLQVEVGIKSDSEKIFHLWQRYGRLVNQEDEKEEGLFVLFYQYVHAMSLDNTSHEERAWLAERFERYFEKFPDSPVVRKINIPRELTGEELLDYLGNEIGLDEESRTHLENIGIELERGSMTVPFLIRSRFLLGVGDHFELFEMALESGVLDRKYSLLTDAEWRQGDLRDIFAQEILIDDVSLLLLSELGVLSSFLQLQEYVFIRRQTLDRIRTAAQGIYWSRAWVRARNLRDQLGASSSKIRHLLLDGSEEPEVGGLQDGSLIELAQLGSTLKDRGIWCLCDDAAMRSFLEEAAGVRTLTILDVLSVLYSNELVSRQGLSKALARLCTFNVTHIAVPIEVFLDLVPVIPGEGSEKILARFDQCKEFRSALSRATHRSGEQMEVTFGKLLARFLSSGSFDSDYVCAVWKQWDVQAVSRTTADFSSENISVALVAALALVSGGKLDSSDYEFLATRLWTVLLRRVEWYKEEQAVREHQEKCIRDLAARIGRWNSPLRDDVCEFMLLGLLEGSSERILFNDAYVQARVDSVTG